MVDVSSCEENVQPDGKGENRFENIYMVITETINCFIIPIINIKEQL
jgi:hypothetical protein